MRDFKKHLEQLPVRDFAWVICDLHRLDVARLAAADHVIVSSRRIAAGISRDDLVHTCDLPKNSLYAPETTSRQHCRLISLKEIPDQTLAVHCRVGKIYCAESRGGETQHASNHNSQARS